MARESTTDLLNRLSSGELSSLQLVTSSLERIDALNGELNAFVAVNGDDAIRQAEQIDRRRAAGESLHPIAGLPIGLKDNICTSDMPTTCGSRMLKDYVSPYEAHVVECLRAAGAVIVGKTNLDEFAMGSSTETSVFGPTRNPFDQNCSPGGSSGGSAAAVAGGMVPLALGSDTGGSIRQPAAFCGVVGLKPTYGRVSRYGLVAFASSLDQIGPMANDVAGAALLLQVLAGHDARDSTSVPRAVPDFVSAVEQEPTGLRIGFSPEFLAEGLEPSVRENFEAALERYRSLGAEVREVPLPHSRYAVAAYYVIAPAEASGNLSRFDGIHFGTRADNYSNLAELYANSRAEGFGNEVRRRILLGTFALSAGYSDQFYGKASKVRRLIRNDYDAAFANVDVIASPVTPTPAFPIGAHADDPLAMYLSDLYTIAANLAGLPAISVPSGRNRNGLPIGLHLTAPAFAEAGLLQAARMLERADS